MIRPLLRVDRLGTWLEGSGGVVRALDGVGFEIARGETFAVVGESGCGKSMTALSVLRLLPETGRIVDGSVALDGAELLTLPEAAMRGVRGRRISMIFQEPATSLNPVLTVGQQIGEVLARHRDLRGGPARSRVLELLDSVGIPDPKQRVDEYPFQFSGGMKQRVMIALALAGEPDLLIADEPTTALDVTIQAQVLDLLEALQKRNGMSILLISHDLGVVLRLAHRVGVMYAGQLVEVASRESFLRRPQHPYSRKLFEALPDARKRGGALAMIPGQVPPLTREFDSCRFAERCPEVFGRCRREIPQWNEPLPGARVRCFRRESTAAPELGAGVPGGVEPVIAPPGGAAKPLLAVADLKVHFPIRKGLLKRTVGRVRAVDGVSLTIEPARTLALVGESGCGKTTVGKAILRLIPPTEGRVVFDGVDLAVLSPSELRQRRRDLQIVFQDPYASLDPRMRVADLLTEGMEALGVLDTAAARARRVEELLERVGLPTDSGLRYPHEFSGGQRQRIGIARALAVEPQVLVADEPVSALDVSVQAQILNLLSDLQRDLGLAYLFITHNLAVVEYLAHEVAVMYLGRIVERGPTHSVLDAPRHPYTQALLSSVLAVGGEAKPRITLRGELPSPAAPPSGCHFHPRCPRAMPQCAQAYPRATEPAPGHEVRCVLWQ